MNNTLMIEIKNSFKYLSDNLRNILFAQISTY